jgi:hypothetical protein
VAARTVLRVGTVRLVASRRPACIGIGRDCREELATQPIVAQATCGPRRTIVFGRAASRVEIVLAGGRRVRPRRADKLYLAVFGPRVAVTGVQLAGRTFPLPGASPSRQCGWEAIYQPNGLP